MSSFCRRKCRIAFSLKKTVDHTGAVSGGQVNGKTLPAERFLNLGVSCLQINLTVIDMIDHHHPALLLLLGPGHHSLADALNTLLGIDDDRYRLHCRQDTKRRAYKIRVARCVNQIDVSILVIKTREGG